jgi:hypothetical protein
VNDVRGRMSSFHMRRKGKKEKGRKKEKKEKQRLLYLRTASTRWVSE